MNITYGSTKINGLETWLVLLDGRVLHTHMGEDAAKYQYKRICQKLGIQPIFKPLKIRGPK